ncbi:MULTISPECIES: glycosyltransferase [unclassified Oceanispirochaeta]|uniref:glycosyltransferase n=1 Tax=unclassified Oceanispirochaeta TaxID=2635722 RepID=UPI000E09B0BA|nr:MULTISPECIES: glycosyltransferase [unclassified Oceanispirochaeta]MBF9017773.1 glycosyltransferase [Oceanispirochaeta sp. M2]NPD74337.1 glycosyltransferase [Oceanispirochaeta sp. M1]RDG29817.1 glycosyltransferase family 1 protein [Oceanispirochaeta sp. M1]
MRNQIFYLYVNGNRVTPSTRLRWLNYIDDFKAAGWDVRVLECAPSRSERRIQFESMEKGSTILVQKKLLAFAELKQLKSRSGSLFLDVDDAIWRTHPHKGNPYVNFLKKVYKRVFLLSAIPLYDKIICANEALAFDLRPINPRIDIVPTSPSDSETTGVVKDDEIFRIVWTGTRANFFYLDEIKDQITSFLKGHDRAELCVISDGEYSIDGSSSQIRNIPWSTDNESLWIQKSSLGIMPLTLDEWSRGKSAFKLIKYMKLGLPVMATDFGFQKDMIKSGENGILVDNSDWQKVLNRLFDNPLHLQQMAEAGHQTYLDSYAPEIIFKAYLEIFKTVKEAVQ